LLPAGERGHARPRLLHEPDLGDHVRRRAPVPVERAKELHRLPHLELLRELRLLKADAEPLTDLAVVVAPAPVEHDHLSSGGSEVVLPAPFGRRSPKHSPARISKLRPRTASSVP